MNAALHDPHFARMAMLVMATLTFVGLIGMWLYMRAIRRSAESTTARSSRAINELRELRRLGLQVQTAVSAERFSEARFSRLLGIIRDAYVAADEHGRIISWNPAAALLFLRSADEAIGLPLVSLMPHRLRERHLAAFEEFLMTRGASAGPEKYIDTVAVDADGDEFPVRIVIWPTELPDAIISNALIHRRADGDGGTDADAR